MAAMKITPSGPPVGSATAQHTGKSRLPWLSSFSPGSASFLSTSASTLSRYADVVEDRHYKAEAITSPLSCPEWATLSTDEAFSLR